MRFLLFLLLCTQLSVAFGADITAVTGLYESSERTSSGNVVGSKSDFGAGATYLDMLNEKMGYYVTGGLNFYNYSGGDAGAPDNFTGTKLGGGIRYYFTPFNTYVVPFASVGAKYQTSQSVDFIANGYVQNRKTGLYYDALAGVRIGLSQKFFMELEIPFFTSPFKSFAKTTRVTQTSTGKTSDDTQTTETALSGKTFESLNAITVGLGIKI